MPTRNRSMRRLMDPSFEKCFNGIFVDYRKSLKGV